MAHIFPLVPLQNHLNDHQNATSLLEWFSPLTWWRKELHTLYYQNNLHHLPPDQANHYVSVFIVHRPYFQHPVTRLLWTQNQVYEWNTFPSTFPLLYHPPVISELKRFLYELNHYSPPESLIHHTSLGPQHEMFFIPTPGQDSTHVTNHSPPASGIVIKEERPDYTDVLWQDSQDPWEEFMSLFSQPHSDTPIQVPDLTCTEASSSSMFNTPGSSSQAPDPNVASSSQPPCSHSPDPYEGTTKYPLLYESLPCGHFRPVYDDEPPSPPSADRRIVS